MVAAAGCLPLPFDRAARACALPPNRGPRPAAILISLGGLGDQRARYFHLRRGHARPRIRGDPCRSGRIPGPFLIERRVGAAAMVLLALLRQGALVNAVGVAATATVCGVDGAWVPLYPGATPGRAGGGGRRRLGLARVIAHLGLAPDGRVHGGLKS